MMETTQENRNWKDNVATFLFWSWNLIFLAFMVFGFAPMLLPNLLLDVRAGGTPVRYLVYALTLSAIPLASVIIGALFLNRSPRRLFAFGYVVEGPLMLLLVIRFFFIRQGTPVLNALMLVAVLGMAAFLWYVFVPDSERYGRSARYLRFIGLTLMLLVSLYAAIWIAFYAAPLIAAFFNWLGRALGDLPNFFRSFGQDIRNMVIEGLAWIPLFVMGFILAVYTGTLFVLTPIVVPFLSVKAWTSSLKSETGRGGWAAPLGLAAITFLAVALVFRAGTHQPQVEAFSLLEQSPQSEQQARALLSQKEEIREGLLNAYLAPYRYISAQGEVWHISDLYENSFGMDRESAFAVQRLYERVASPLLYDPVEPVSFDQRRDNFALQKEPEEAAQLYQQFFDETIVEGEHDEVVAAVRSTWVADQAQAALRSIDDLEVHLEHQEITVNAHDDWADVEIFESYRNQVSQQQEVVYYFSLPESAVLTGVWLGNSPDRDSRFQYVVAPRGAAQKVYREQFVVRRDPALLEQIGPRQYRLRVFPIPPLLIQWNESGTGGVIEEADSLYMWLTYQTTAQEGGWPLPRLAEWRNVYWDKDTERLLNGQPYDAPADAWLPETVPGMEAGPPSVHRVDLPGGQTVLAIPAGSADLPVLPQGLRLAVVLDRSLSMTELAPSIQESVEQLRNLPGTKVDMYLTASPFRGEDPEQVALEEWDSNNLVFFGGQNAAELLAQYDQLRGESRHDAILVLTDSSGYELGKSPFAPSTPESPVWMVHLDDQISLGYDDATMEAIQASGGGVAGSVAEALERIAVSLQVENGSRDLVDGYLWTVLPTQEAGQAPAGMQIHDLQDGFAAFAARRLILAEVHRQAQALGDGGVTSTRLETLDQLHALAKEYGIVTPYSSMIVLVEWNQKRMLEALENNSDRFEREYEDVGGTTPESPMPLAGVPEPEEWLLIGLAAALLLWTLYQKKFAVAEAGPFKRRI